MLRTFDTARWQSFWHRMAHVAGTYTGEVVSWTMDGAVWVGFQCGQCGNIEGVHIARGGINDA